MGYVFKIRRKADKDKPVSTSTYFWFSQSSKFKKIIDVRFARHIPTFTKCKKKKLGKTENITSLFISSNTNTIRFTKLRNIQISELLFWQKHAKYIFVKREDVGLKLNAQIAVSVRFPACTISCQNCDKAPGTRLKMSKILAVVWELLYIRSIIWIRR